LPSHAIPHGDRQAIQKLESFILATVKIADHYCSIGGVHNPGIADCGFSISDWGTGDAGASPAKDPLMKTRARLDFPNPQSEIRNPKCAFESFNRQHAK